MSESHICIIDDGVECHYFKNFKLENEINMLKNSKKKMSFFHI